MSFILKKIRYYRWEERFGDIVLEGKKQDGFDGIHEIKIHKDYWCPVEADLDTLEELQLKDKFYPNNLKLLIEGYQYGDNYSEAIVYYELIYFLNEG